MEFANNQCFLCGAKLAGKEPEDETRVDKTYIGPPGRIVEFCSPCPSCGKLIPVCVEGRVPTPKPETDPEAGPETDPETEPEAGPETEPE